MILKLRPIRLSLLCIQRLKPVRGVSTVCRGQIGGGEKMLREVRTVAHRRFAEHGETNLTFAGRFHRSQQGPLPPE